MSSSTLHNFVRNNDLESIRALFEQGGEEGGVVDVDSVEASNDLRHSPLIEAIIKNNEEIARFLIRVGGADVHFRDVNGATPLHYVNRKRNVKLAQLLIEAGANVNSRCNDGRRRRRKT